MGGGGGEGVAFHPSPPSTCPSLPAVVPLTGVGMTHGAGHCAVTGLVFTEAVLGVLVQATGTGEVSVRTAPASPMCNRAKCNTPLAFTSAATIPTSMSPPVARGASAGARRNLPVGLHHCQDRRFPPLC
jgi:hypothetical protein